MGSSSNDRHQRVVYSGRYNLPLLSEELYDTFPKDRIKVMAAQGGIRIVFPRATPKALVDAIVLAHDHTKESKNEKDKKEKKKLRKGGKKKLKGLGLTQAEVDAIIGADEH